MTRFARAKGSKASNEKTPEDSTPWAVMQEQLAQAKKDREESKNRKEAEQQRMQNYETFLKEQKTQKRTNTWFDFPDEESKVNKTVKSVPPPEDQPVKKKSKGKNLLNKQPSDAGKKNKQNNQEAKSNQGNLSVNSEPENDESNLEVSPSKAKNKKSKKSTNKQTPSTIGKSNNNDQPVTANNKNKRNKKKKLNDDQPTRRKPLNDRSFELILNGKKVELLRYDGFPVMKKDAERLEELKNNMIKKGIPKSEVLRTMKLERRRAEKALARLKRDVCYNCRKGGHNLSDCPDLKSKIPGADGADGICFKCGSTEHKQFECRVQKDQIFRFASCFICKEQGHIARQCPDNPKGLYPNGGGCKLCGDVTHLRKDCQTTHDKREETNIRLETLDSGENLEEIQQQNMTANKESTKKVKKIKF